jgi:hypothetical protein
LNGRHVSTNSTNSSSDLLLHTLVLHPTPTAGGGDACSSSSCCRYCPTHLPLRSSRCCCCWAVTSCVSSFAAQQICVPVIHVIICSTISIKLTVLLLLLLVVVVVVFRARLQLTFPAPLPKLLHTLPPRLEPPLLACCAAEVLLCGCLHGLVKIQVCTNLQAGPTSTPYISCCQQVTLLQQRFIIVKVRIITESNSSCSCMRWPASSGICLRRRALRQRRLLLLLLLLLLLNALSCRP